MFTRESKLQNKLDFFFVAKLWSTSVTAITFFLIAYIESKTSELEKVNQFLIPSSSFSSLVNRTRF